MPMRKGWGDPLGAMGHRRGRRVPARKFLIVIPEEELMVSIRAGADEGGKGRPAAGVVVAAATAARASPAVCG